MYVICVYDVEEKRCSKVMKILRKYLFHVQNSVFEGELTPAKMKYLKTELNSLIYEQDSLIFYYVYENKKVNREAYGKELIDQNIII